MKTKHSQETKTTANKRFAEMAMPLTVHKELGIPYDTVYGWWRKFNNRPIPRKPKFVAAAGDAQDGGE